MWGPTTTRASQMTDLCMHYKVYMANELAVTYLQIQP